jgi:choline/ethanolamine kinase
LPNQTSSSILEKVFSEDLRFNVLEKITLEHLYDENELSILQEIKDFVEDDEQQKILKSFVEVDEKERFKDDLVFCHNDLNQLNIFLTPQKDREVVLIDYDYCSYNYATYDIANFLNE